MLRIFFLSILSVVTTMSFASGSQDCGSLTNHYGPFDYTNPAHVSQKLGIVEKYHFTKQVEQLIKAESGYIVADLDYTLRAFPNHHRALVSMALYQIKNPNDISAHYYTIECYFERALSFKPTDAMVMMIKGIYFHKIKKYTLALEAYKEALEFIPENAELNYNLGLTYFALKQYDKARKHAKKAYNNNYPLPGLKMKLKELSKWE